MQGRIVKQISNQYTVNIKGLEYVCVARGKFRKLNLSPLVGDIVDVNVETLQINDIMSRKNELKRPVVANVDIALIVTSVKKPDLSLSLLDKQLSVIIASNIKPVICFTKLDLLNKNEKRDIQRLMNYYKSIGILVLNNKNLFKLKKVLKNNVVVLTGQTGAGKSSLLNKLDKKLNLETKPISEALNRGVHTTRHTEIHEIKKIYFVDTPGFSSLDINTLSKEQIRSSFLEFNGYICKFSDCYHLNEKGCGIKLEIGKKILPSRYINYGRFIKECNENSSKLYK